MVEAYSGHTMKTQTWSTMQLALVIATLLPYSCHAQFEFAGSTIISNNLGGLGPVLADPEELRFTNLTMLDLPNMV